MLLSPCVQIPGGVWFERGPLSKFGAPSPIGIYPAYQLEFVFLGGLGRRLLRLYDGWINYNVLARKPSRL